MIAFVAASPSIDRTHVVDAVTPGEIHRPQAVVAVAGGKALNAARAAHALGADVHAIALLGGHTGRWVAAALEEEGVTCDAVPGPGETRICLSVSDGEALTEFYEPGPELTAEHWARAGGGGRSRRGARDVGRRRRLAAARARPPDAAARLLRVARAGRRARRARRQRRGAPPRPRGRPRLRQGQRRRSGGARVRQRRGAPRSGRARRGRRAGPAAAITHGADGMELATPDGEPLRAVPPRLGAYPVGSGDAALGGFLAALDAGASWPEALARAAGAAAANAQVPGAGRLG